MLKQLMTKIKSNNSTHIIFSILISITCFLPSCQDTDAIRNNMERTSAIVNHTKIIYSKGERCQITYSFKDLTLFQNDLVNCDCERLEGKYFEVIYEKSNPKNSVLLTKYSYYRDYHLYVPDSLKWIERCGD
jgi:hypothetical protein